MKRPAWRGWVCASACFVAAAWWLAVPAATSAAQASGALVPLLGGSACLTGVDNETGPCIRTSPFSGPTGAINDVAMSPDGRHLYVVSDYAIWTVARDVRSGMLRRVQGRAGCVKQWRPRRRCAFGRGLAWLESIDISSDGRHVYAAGSVSRALVVLKRDPHSGRLEQLRGRAGCVSHYRTACARGGARGMVLPMEVVVSDSGRSVYVASASSIGHGGGSVALLIRNRRTGALRQPRGPRGCVASHGDEGCATARGLEEAGLLSMTDDGTRLFVSAGRASPVLAIFRRWPGGRVRQLDGEAGCLAKRSAVALRLRLGCRAVDGLAVGALAPSPDGHSLYVPSGTGARKPRITVLRRGNDGTFRQAGGRAGCVASRPVSRGCHPARGLYDVADALVSHDGRNVYAGTSTGWAAFRRLSDGSLRQIAGPFGCGTWDAEEPEGCMLNDLPWVGLDHITGSPDARHVYLADDLTLGGLRRLP
jgi:DNA-binding beta-propeller fold protein YncE